MQKKDRIANPKKDCITVSQGTLLEIKKIFHNKKDSIHLYFTHLLSLSYTHKIIRPARRNTDIYIVRNFKTPLNNWYNLETIKINKDIENLNKVN